MSEDEAYRLLAKAAGLSENVDALGEELVKHLGYFPLAIVQAGAYIQTNTCSTQDYLDMYGTSRGQILEDYASEVQKADDYELTVYATWQVSYRKLTPLARRLFDHLAFMHHDQIVEDIFRFALQGFKIENPFPPDEEEAKIEQMAAEFLANFTSLVDGAWDKAAFLRATKDLASYSLLAYDSLSRSYSIHPLVQQWTCTVATDSDRTRSCVAFLLASSVIRVYRSEDYAYRRVLLNHVDRLPDSERRRPQQAWRLQLVYKESGRWKEAEIMQEAILEVGKRVWGNKHFETLLAMSYLADTYSRQGRWDEAEALQQEMVEIGKRVRGNEHPDTLAAMNDLTLTYSRQGRWDEAEALQREAVEIGKRVRGSEHPNTLIAMGNLALAYSNQGRWDEAGALQRQVVEVGKRVWGNEHPNTLISLDRLASTYLSQGRWDEAEKLQREVVE
ncbi:hypothetical protein FRC07_014354, partial [Ceratobasidium sp. 392]